MVKELQVSKDELKPETRLVLESLYDHLLEHPFFDQSIRKLLEIDPNEDVSGNDEYWGKMEELVDQTLAHLAIINKSKRQTH